jgi:hypothetical protein
MLSLLTKLGWDIRIEFQSTRLSFETFCPSQTLRCQTAVNFSEWSHVYYTVI